MSGTPTNQWPVWAKMGFKEAQGSLVEDFFDQDEWEHSLMFQMCTSSSFSVIQVVSSLSSHPVLSHIQLTRSTPLPHVLRSHWPNDLDVRGKCAWEHHGWLVWESPDDFFQKQPLLLFQESQLICHECIKLSEKPVFIFERQEAYLHTLTPSSYIWISVRHLHNIQYLSGISIFLSHSWQLLYSMPSRITTPIRSCPGFTHRHSKIHRLPIKT